MTIATISTYVKAHERLVLAGIAAVLLWFAVGHIEGIIARHDNANLQQAQVVAQAQADKTAAIAEQVAQQSAQYASLAAKVQQQNDALMQANVALSTALAKQQHSDATLPPSDLVARWNALVPQAKPTVTATGIAVDTPSAVATLQQLEIIPVQQQELTNTQKELENAQSLVTAEGQQMTTLNTEVGSLRTQLGDNQAVCQAQIAVVKAQARKRQRWVFAIGYAAGWVSRQVVKTYTGL